MQTDDEIDDAYLLRMCDYAAMRYSIDPTIIHQFNVMPCEVDKLKQYMKEKYPTVPYLLMYPTGQKS